MEVVREIFRLSELGFGQHPIARALRVAQSTVQDYLRKGWEVGLSYGQSKLLDDKALRALLSKREPGRTRKVALNLQEPNFALVALELKSRKGVTLELLWKEWVESGGGGYS